MISHTQTHTGTHGDTVPGNCLQTSVASLLDLPLDAVPHFALFGTRLGLAVALRLDATSRHLHVYTDSLELVDGWDGWGISTSPHDTHPDGELILAHGASREGLWRHVVLWHGGMIHDPNSAGRGLAGEPDEVWQISTVLASHFDTCPRVAATLDLCQSLTMVLDESST